MRGRETVIVAAARTPIGKFQGALKTLKIKLGAPNYPGDTMTFTGSVTDKREADRSVELTLAGRNAMGPHVTGTVRVQLP